MDNQEKYIKRFRTLYEEALRAFTAMKKFYCFEKIGTADVTSSDWAVCWDKFVLPESRFEALGVEAQKIFLRQSHGLSHQIKCIDLELIWGLKTLEEIKKVERIDKNKNQQKP